MPELPEVERFRRYFNRYAAGQTLLGVSVPDTRDFRGLPHSEIENHLKQVEFLPARRLGKYLILSFLQGRGERSRGALVMHFGMTGDLRFVRGESQAPQYSRVAFRFSGGALHYVNMRRFGGIWWTPSPEEFKGLAILGPDALAVEDPPSLRAALVRTRQPMKQAFLNQRLVCGIGNLYADEILFQSRISPRRRPQSLKPADWTRLFRAMARVLRTALSRNADFDRYPAGYLLRHRKRGGFCPRCRTGLSTTTQGQRTTIYCAQCQK